MSTEVEQFTGRLVGRLCAQLTSRSQLGVMAENLPPLDVGALIEAIAEVAEEFDWGRLRLAVLGDKRRRKKSHGPLELTWDPLEANQWRNDVAARDGVRSIVVVLGPAAKLNSLRTALRPLRVKELRAEIVRVTDRWLPQPERRYFWRALADRSRDIPTASLLDYAARLEASAKKSPAQLLELEQREVWSLGLLSSPKLSASNGSTGAKKALRSNLEQVRALPALSDKVRATLVELSEQGDTQMQSDADQMLSYIASRDRAALRGLTLERVRELLRAKSSSKETETKTSGGSVQPKRERVEGDVFALDLLLEGGKGLKKAAKEYAKVAEPSPEDGGEVEEVSVSGRVIMPQLREGSRQSAGLFAAMLDEERWGGVVVAPEVVDFVSATKMVASGDAALHPFVPAEKEHVRGMLERVVNRRWVEVGALEAFDRYAELRAELLPHQSALQDHPLLALAANKRLAEQVGELLAAYGQALEFVKDAAEALHKQGSLEPSRRLVARMLSLDVVFINAGEEWFAVAAPTHPFHLWRIHALIEVFEGHLDELRDIGHEELEEVIADPHTATPHLVLSRYAINEASLPGTLTLTAAGSYGALPMFADPKSRQGGKFRSKALAKLAERLMRLMPHAAIGLRMALIDPPSVAGALERLQSLTNPLDDELPVPLHVSIYRTRPNPEATDEEDDKLNNLGREIVDAGGTLQVYPTVSTLGEIAERLERRPVHMVAVFDPGEAEVIKLSAPRPRLSPLALPRSYQYDGFDDRIDVVISGDIPLFGSYHELFCRTIDAPTSDILGRRSGASRTSEDLERLGAGTVWTTVLDQGIEPTFRIRGAERLDWRQDAGRDVVTVTARRETVEFLVRDALNYSGLPATEERVKQTLEELFSLSGEAILGLLRAQIGTSLVEPRFAKGLLGTLIAARWYLRAHPNSLLISLDEPTSRRWILGVASDNRRGDLLGLRSGPDGPVLEAIEVKTHDDPQAAVTPRRKTLEGKAVVQVDQTIAILDGIIGAPESAVARARESILKDQLYRAVAARTYPSDQRERLVRTLEELFREGPAEVSGLIFVVKIAPNETPIFPDAPTEYRSPAKNKVGLVELVETGAQQTRYKIPTPPPSTVEDAATDRGSESGKKKADEKKPKKKKAKKKSNKRRAEASNEELRVVIGEAPAGGEVVWAPHDEDRPLNNFGLLVTGDSGAGKTQMLRAIIHEIAKTGLPICAFDYKNDYADPEYSELVGLEVYDVNHNGLPFNPLELVFDASGRIQPVRHVHNVAGILKRVFGLGDQMAARLRKAMKAAYQDRGVDPKEWLEVGDAPEAPSFGDVIEILEHDSKNEKLLNRLSPLFDLGLFPSSAEAESSFEELLEQQVVLLMNGLPDERIKQAISEFIIVRLHAHALRGEQPRRLRRLLVFDEAWRIKDSTHLHQLAREGRAFGIGVALGTQFPGDIPDNLSGNLASQLFLQNQSSEHRRSVIRTLLGTNSGRSARALEKQLQQLQKHEGFFRNQQYAPYTFVTTTPHYQRVE